MEAARKAARLEGLWVQFRIESTPLDLLERKGGGERPKCPGFTAAIPNANGRIEGLSDIEAYTSKTAEVQEQSTSLKDEIAKKDEELADLRVRRAEGRIVHLTDQQDLAEPPNGNQQNVSPRYNTKKKKKRKMKKKRNVEKGYKFESDLNANPFFPLESEKN